MRTLWLMLILTEILKLVHGESVCLRNDTDPRVQRSRETLLRRRRQLTFPKGSAFVMTLSLLKAIQVTEPRNWNLAVEVDVIWPIPNQPGRRKTSSERPWKIKRRHRREIYANFEMALNRENLPGRSCVLLTICQANSLLNPPGLSFVEDLLRIILSNEEPSNRLDHYDIAYRTKKDCHLTYPCPYSILQLFLTDLYTDVANTNV